MKPCDYRCIAVRETGFASGMDGGAGGFGMLPLQGQQMQMRYMADQLRKELQQRSFLTHAQVSRYWPFRLFTRYVPATGQHAQAEHDFSALTAVHSL